MSEADRRVGQAAKDARSNDDFGQIVWDEIDMFVSLDEETLDEQASTQMGPLEPRRRDAQ